MRRTLLLLSIFMVFISGCGKAVAGESGISTEIPSLTVEPPTLAPLRTATPFATPTVPTPTPTLTATPTLTPTPTLPPMSIQAMRARSYPGSDIVIEKELARGANYRRFYVSYLSDGLKIYALLTVPDGEMPAGGWPGIVFNHGYIPPKQYRTTERYIAYVDWLARAGYIVFRIDYRGNDQSEGVATGAYGDPGYTDDVLNAVASLQRFPQANPQKIGMWGHSMGGFLTLRAMVISDAIKVGVIWSGVVGSYADLIYNWHHFGVTPTPPPEARGWRAGWMDQYGTPEQNPAFWNSISANAYLADLSGPLQLHTSTADSEVPAAFSEKLAADIQAADGTVELYTYSGDDHNLAQSFSLAMRRTIEFYDRYLK
jgi:dipeptidyl aminopeptidase/acylaminoacyl peptidase